MHVPCQREIYVELLKLWKACLCWMPTICKRGYTLGRLRERTKRDESDSGDGSGNVSDAGLDLTGSGHSSRRVQGFWLARPIESNLVRKRPQNILTSTGAGWIFEDFLSFDFFSVLHVSLFFSFDHADCSTCFLLAKNGIVIVTRHSASESSDENAHTEVQHLPSAAFLDQFLRSRPGQLQS